MLLVIALVFSCLSRAIIRHHRSWGYQTEDVRSWTTSKTLGENPSLKRWYRNETPTRCQCRSLELFNFHVLSFLLFFVLFADAYKFTVSITAACYVLKWRVCNDNTRKVVNVASMWRLLVCVWSRRMKEHKLNMTDSEVCYCAPGDVVCDSKLSSTMWRVTWTWWEKQALMNTVEVLECWEHEKC